MNTLESISEIKSAVDSGIPVYCDSKSYIVMKDNVGQYLIKCILNGYCVGLHGVEGSKYENNLNGSNFFTE